MQRDQVVGDGHDVVGASGRHEPVPHPEPGAALGRVDASDGHGGRRRQARVAAWSGTSWNRSRGGRW